MKIDTITRLRALATRLAGAPKYTEERAATIVLIRAPCNEDSGARQRLDFQTGALEQICRSSADEIMLIIRHIERAKEVADDEHQRVSARSAPTSRRTRK